MTHVKSAEGYDVKVPSMGQVNYNTVASSIGLANAVFGNNGGGLLSWLTGNRNGNGCNCGCESDHVVNRYELAMEQALAAKDSKIALLEANIYNDQKSLELYKYVDGQFKEVREFICEQKVRNQGVGDAVRELDKKIDYSIALEAERRKCADNSIVGYLNSTFAPKAVADYTAGSTSAVMQTRNPLCECNC